MIQIQSNINYQAQTYLRNLEEPPEVFVGVHVRRTDYIDFIRNRYKVS